MVSQFTAKHAGKYGDYNKSKHSIRHEGQVVIKDGEGKRIETLDEVGMDYGTFRMKFGTSDNPTWHNTPRVLITELQLGSPKYRVVEVA